MDFTSHKYPFVSKYFDESEEGHDDSVSESVHSNVVDYDHPLLSVTQLKNTLNQYRKFGNAKEKLITGDIKEDVLKSLINIAYKEKFPIEPLIFMLDIKKKMDDRSSASDATEIIEKVKQYVPQLSQSLGRQPYNSEVLMAFMLGGVDKVKMLVDKAKKKPYEESTPIGSEFDSIVFYKNRIDKNVIRKNREILQFFSNRMQLGSDFFPHTPFKQGNKSVA